MDCTPATLVQNARCLCIPSGQRWSVMAYLLCQWAQQENPVGCGTPSDFIQITGAGTAGANQVYEFVNLIIGYRGRTDPNFTIKQDLNGNWWIYEFLTGLYTSTPEDFPCVWTIGSGAGTEPAPTGQWVNFSYEPQSRTVTWSDVNGTFSGNLAFFRANADIPTVNDIDLGASGITSVSGLIELVALTSLKLGNCPITSLDLVGFGPTLQILDTTGTLLPALNLSGFTALLTLFADSSPITSLNLSGCTSLTYVECAQGTGPLTTLNVTGCTALTILKCFGNSSLTTITGLTTCTSLVNLDANTCDLTGAIDLTFMPAAVLDIDLSGNPNITSIDLSGTTSIATNFKASSTASSITACDLSDVQTIGSACSLPACADVSSLTSVGGDLSISDGVAPAAFTATLLVTMSGAISCSNTTKVTGISLPVVDSADSVHCENSAITSFSAPSMTSCADVLNFSGCAALTSVNFTSLGNTNGNIDFDSDASIVTISFPVLSFNAGSSATFIGCTSLTNFSAPNWAPPNLVDFTGDNLTQASVDGILALCVTAGLTAATISLNGGTNAQPSACTDVNTLRTSGCTVNVNGPC